MGSEYETGLRGRFPGFPGWTCQRCGRIDHTFDNAAMRYCESCRAFENPLSMPRKKAPPARQGRVGPEVRMMLFDEIAEMQDKLRDLERLEQIRRDRQYVIEEEP